MMREYREEPPIHKAEADNVGDPDDESISELTGVAPPCDNCGKRPTVDNGVCDECEPNTAP